MALAIMFLLSLFGLGYWADNAATADQRMLAQVLRAIMALAAIIWMVVRVIISKRNTARDIRHLIVAQTNKGDMGRGVGIGDRHISGMLLALLISTSALTGTTLLGCGEETQYFPNPERRLVILAKLPVALDQREKLIADVCELIYATTINDPYSDSEHGPPVFRLVRVKWVNTNGDFEFPLVKIDRPSDRHRAVARLAAFREDTLQQEPFVPDMVNDFEELDLFASAINPPSDVLYVNYMSPNPKIPDNMVAWFAKRQGCFQNIHFTFVPRLHQGMKAAIEQMGGCVDIDMHIDWYRDRLVSETTSISESDPN